MMYLFQKVLKKATKFNIAPISKAVEDLAQLNKKGKVH